jgi:hypothetical protein
MMGATLDLTLGDPDLAAGFLNAGYNSSTGILSATGWPISFDLNGTMYPSIVGGQYTLSTHVNSAGQAGPGALDITGTIPNLASSGTLLTGQLSEFGFQPGGGDIFEFDFDITGGDLAPYYDGHVSIVLDAQDSGFDGSFSKSFEASPYLSVADNGIAVPEPTAFVLLACASAVGLAIHLCHRRVASK